MAAPVDDWENIKMDVRALIQSAPGGLPLDVLDRDYYDNNGSDLPYQFYGFQNLQEMIMAMGDVAFMMPRNIADEHRIRPSVGVSGSDPDCDVILFPMKHEQTEHLTTMINRQKPAQITRIGKRIPELRDADRRENYEASGVSNGHPPFPIPREFDVTHVIKMKAEATSKVKKRSNEAKACSANVPDLLDSSVSVSSEPNGLSHGSDLPVTNSGPKTKDVSSSYLRSARSFTAASTSSQISEATSHAFSTPSLTDTFVRRTILPNFLEDDGPNLTNDLTPTLVPVYSPVEVEVPVADLITFSDASSSSQKTNGAHMSSCVFDLPSIQSTTNSQVYKQFTDATEMEKEFMKPVFETRSAPATPPAHSPNLVEPTVATVILWIINECGRDGIRQATLQTLLDECPTRFGIWLDIADKTEYQVDIALMLYLPEEVETTKSGPTGKHTWLRCSDYSGFPWSPLVSKDTSLNELNDAATSLGRYSQCLADRLANCQIYPIEQVEPSFSEIDQIENNTSTEIQNDDVEAGNEASITSHDTTRMRPNSEFLRRTVESNEAMNMRRVESRESRLEQLSQSEQEEKMSEAVQIIFSLIDKFTARLDVGLVMKDLKEAYEIEYDQPMPEELKSKEIMAAVVSEIQNRTDIFHLEKNHSGDILDFHVKRVKGHF